MDFLGIGPGEILLILVLALILLGPGKIPEIARTIGKTIRAIKKASADLTTTVSRELEAGEKPAAPARPKTTPPSGGPPATPAGKDQPTEPGGTAAAP